MPTHEETIKELSKEITDLNRAIGRTRERLRRLQLQNVALKSAIRELCEVTEEDFDD